MRDIKPIIGYVHTGIEKTAEDKTYWKVIPVVERMDYLSYYFNAMAFCGAVETLLGARGPQARPVPARDPPRAQPHRQPPRLARRPARWTSARSRCSGTASASASMILDLFESPRASACTRATSRSAASIEDIPRGLEREAARVHARSCPSASTSTRRCSTGTRSSLQRLQGTSAPLDERDAARPRRHRPAAARRRQPVGPAQGRCRTRSYEDFDFKIPVGTDRRQLRPLRGAPRGDLRVGARSSSRRSTACPRARTSPTDRKVALPPRHELATSMEALIHHFKLVTEGFRVPPGEVYYPIESPARRARLLRALRRLLQAGARAHARPLVREPAGARARWSKGTYIADMIATLAMLDPILGGIDR